MEVNSTNSSQDEVIKGDAQKQTQSLLNRLRLAGCQFANDTKVEASVEIANRLAILFAILLIPYICFLIYDGFYTYIPLVLLFIVGCFGVPYLNSIGKLYKAKLFLLVLINVSLFVFTCIFGREIRISIIFVNLLVTPIILFSYQHPETKFGKIFGLALPVIGLFITETFHIQTEHFRPGTLVGVQLLALFTTIFSGLMRQRQWDAIYMRNEKEMQLKQQLLVDSLVKSKQYLKTAEEAKFRLEMAMKAVKFGIWDWDIKNNILIWDDDMYKIFEIDKSDFEGAYHAFEKTLLAEDQARVNDELQATFANKNDYASEFRIRTKAGLIKNIRAEAKCFYNEQGEILRAVGANWDVTDLRVAEEKLEEQSIALVQSSKMSALGQMSAGVAHEINNPLAVIKGKSYQIQTAIKRNEIDPEKMTQQVQHIDQMVERIIKIISGLRSFARDGQNDPFEKASLKNIIDETLILCKSRFVNKDVELRVDNLDPLLFLECRSVQISQVILNLLNNAMDAVAELPEKWVAVQIEANKQSVIIKVIDSGHGIPKAIKDKILEPFYTTKEIGKGTGLGLSISNGIIKNHHGSLDIDDSSPHTCFKVTLPLKQESVQ